MRRCFKYLLICGLLLALLAGLGVATFPWWGPPLLQQAAEKFLREAGFEATELSLERIGLRDLQVEIGQLRFEGVTVSGGTLVVGYNYEGLRRRELEQISLAQAEVEVDLLHTWALPGDAVEPAAWVLPDQLSELFPVKKIDLVDARLTLRAGDAERSFGLDGQIAGQEHLDAQLALNGAGMQLRLQGDVRWPDLSGRVDAALKVVAAADWLAWGRDRGWVTWPEGLDVSTGPVAIEAAADFAGPAIRSWRVEGMLARVAASLERERASTSRVEFKLRGKGAQLGELALDLGDGIAGYDELNLTFDRFQVSADSFEQLDLNLAGWELNGDSGVEGLGEVSASAGDLELSLAGDWQVWHSEFDPAQLAVVLRIEPAPLSLFTGLGSASGAWQLEASMAAGAARTLSLSTELRAASLAGAGASLESARLTASVQGGLPNALEAVIGLDEGQVVWSEGGGRLKGLSGEVELASILPPASKGQQSLRFRSIEQGDFTTDSGQLQFRYTDAPEDGPPLTLEIATRAMGGDVRIVVDGQVRAPFSSSVRVFMEAVELEQIAALFPQFDGRIEGKASGEVAFRIQGNRIVLQPGGFQLTEGASGRFQYLRQGWLTQDARLNPEEFVGGRDIVAIMRDPQGATALTELAMRDLKMSSFSLRIEETPTGAQEVKAQIRGEREIRGVTVPVVLDVPIRGDVRETINAVFEFNARM